MGDIKGFLKFRREGPKRRPVEERTRDWREFYQPVTDQLLQTQAARCMDCGVPFCQGTTGCPVQNMIPDWNDLVFRGRWDDALRMLHSTNNFPEFTGRLCPAPCETACVLGIIDDPVSIRVIEWNIIDKGFADGSVVPILPDQESGQKIAIVGSGPAGLACAQQLRRLGHAVTVFEKDDRIGGLLRYGIPDFKMEKWVIDRRLEQMIAEGVDFRTNTEVGKDLPAERLLQDFDAVCLAAGAMEPRDLKVTGRELRGIHLAMEYLTQQNRRNAGDLIDPQREINAEGKRVVIIGGGDTGSDCLGTAHRQGAQSIEQFELLSEPPALRSESTPWPLWPLMLRTSHAHEEGGMRRWSVSTKGFFGDKQQVARLHAVRVELRPDRDGRSRFIEIPGSDFEIPADLVLLAMGFSGPVKKGLLDALGIGLDARGNIAVDSNQMTSVEGVFAAGDIKRGASLIVWAIREGRDAAKGIDRYLKEKRNTSPHPT